LAGNNSSKCRFSTNILLYLSNGQPDPDFQMAPFSMTLSDL